MQNAKNSSPGADFRLGFYLSLATTLLTLVTFAIAILTPPLSGPFCVEGCFSYPFADIASRFPRDYYWMFPAMLLMVTYLAWMACLHQVAPQEKKVFSLIGLSFAIIAAVVLLIDYFVQVSVIQPSLLQGETDGIAILTQYNAHGIFIALEELGYLMMSFSFIAVAPVFSTASGVGRALRWVLGIGFLLSLIALAGISIGYGLNREYRFEVAIITLVWLVLIAAGALTAVLFRRAVKALKAGNVGLLGIALLLYGGGCSPLDSELKSKSAPVEDDGACIEWSAVDAQKIRYAAAVSADTSLLFRVRDALDQHLPAIVEATGQARPVTIGTEVTLVENGLSLLFADDKQEPWNVVISAESISHSNFLAAILPGWSVKSSVYSSDVDVRAHEFTTPYGELTYQFYEQGAFQYEMRLHVADVVIEAKANTFAELLGKTPVTTTASLNGRSVCNGADFYWPSLFPDFYTYLRFNELLEPLTGHSAYREIRTIDADGRVAIGIGK